MAKMVFYGPELPPAMRKERLKAAKAAKREAEKQLKALKKGGTAGKAFAGSVTDPLYRRALGVALQAAKAAARAGKRRGKKKTTRVGKRRGKKKAASRQRTVTAAQVIKQAEAMAKRARLRVSKARRQVKAVRGIVC